MATELEKALERAKYAALPLPRSGSAPTTIFAFTDGHLYIVRNPHSCLPDPPIKVTPDPAVDTLEFTRVFNFEFKGIVGFFTRLLGIGNAKAEFEFKSIKTATVQMGGLSHHTIETGGLVDYLLQQDPNTSCMRNLLDRDNFTIVAALQANTFTYTFKNQRGAIVKFSVPDASNLFKADVNVKVDVTEEGKIVVAAPRYVGVITWDGRTVAKQLEKARRSTGIKGLRAITPARVEDAALDPSEVYARQIASLRRRPAGTRMNARPERKLRRGA
jgi:hypothetical protein